MSRLPALVCVLAVAAGAVSVAVVAAEPSVVPSPGRGSVEVTPTDALLSCPEPPTAAVATTEVVAVTPANATGDEGDGSLDLGVLAPSKQPPLVSATRPGSAVRRELTTEAESPVIVTASGDRAPGLSAFQLSTSAGQPRTGLAVSACQRPADEWWFSGVSTGGGATSRLILTNPSPAVAIADVTIFGPDGVLTGAGSRGIALAPQSRQSIDLARFAPGLEAATVTVRADRGRVVAAVAMTVVDGATPAGSQWIPASAPPATDTVIEPGLGGRGDRTLVLTNPGPREALVQVEALDESGPFKPTALTDLRIEPESVLVEDVAAITDGRPVGLHLTSNVAVTGAIVATTVGPVRDIATSTTSSPLVERAVVPMVAEATLTLCAATADRSGGDLTARLVAADGTSVQKVEFGATGGATTCRVVNAPARSEYVVVTVVAGDGVSAVAHYSGPAGVESLPVLSGVWSIERPGVVPLP